MTRKHVVIGLALRGGRAGVCADVCAMAAGRSARHAERTFGYSATRSFHCLRRSFRLLLLPRRNRAHLQPHGHGAFVFQSTSRLEQLRRWRRRSPLSQGIRPPLQRVRARWKVVSTAPSDRLRRTGDERARARGDYVIGSGNHARTFLHRNADGRLVQMPVSWYAERGGYWAMSPGYDRPAHLDFRRVIDAGCMSCHNGYPRAPRRGRSVDGPKFGRAAARGHRLPAMSRSGTGTRRCGESRRPRSGRSGDRESREARSRPPARIVHAVSPRVDEQPLPFQIPRYEHPPFSYTPGKAAERLLHPFRSRARAPAATTSSRSPAARTACASRHAFSAAR